MKNLRKLVALGATVAFLTAGISTQTLAAETTATLSGELLQSTLEDVFMDVGDIFADGSEKTPFLIDSVEDLKNLSNIAASADLTGVYFKQRADIIVNTDANVSNGANLNVFAPIGTKASPFKGNYNGMDYVIRGLVSDEADTSGLAGLFGCTSGAVLENIRVENALLYATGYTGGICAKADGTTSITNSSFDGEIRLLNTTGLLASRTGGVAGYVDTTATVTACTADVNLNITDTPFVLYAGGIVGSNAGTVSECTVTGDLDTTSTTYLVALGGIAGANTGSVMGCENKAYVSGDLGEYVSSSYVGGIVGFNDEGAVERSDNAADVTASGYDTYPAYVGGLVGYNRAGSVSICVNSGTITTTTAAYTGGIAGINLSDNTTAANIENALNNGTLNAQSSIAGGLVGANIANAAGSKATVNACVNLDGAGSGEAAVGEITATEGTSTITDNYALNKAQTGVTTKTEADLIAATSLNGLANEAWVYPQNGFLPALAVVKNLNKAEVVDIALDKTANKAAFAVYNPGAAKTATAILAYYQGGKLLGAASVSIDMVQGYGVYTAESVHTAAATDVRIVLLNDMNILSPAASMAKYN